MEDEARRRVREVGVGVVSEAAKRERAAGGVANAVGVTDRRRRLWRAAAGEEKVLPIGLEMESSGDEGPVEIGKIGNKLIKLGS